MGKILDTFVTILIDSIEESEDYIGISLESIPDDERKKEGVTKEQFECLKRSFKKLFGKTDVRDELIERFGKPEKGNPIYDVSKAMSEKEAGNVSQKEYEGESK